MAVRSCSVVATARPTFDVGTGRTLATAARELLRELGADVRGPDGVLTDVAAAREVVLPRNVSLQILVCATFADASMALELFGRTNRPLLLWAFREPGVDGERLWLNSLCGANLAAHALVERGVSVRLLYGNPDELAVRTRLAEFLTDGLPPIAAPHDGRGEADRDEARAALERLRHQRIGLVGDAPVGFTPCAADPEALERLFGLELVGLGLSETFDAVRAVSDEARAAERAAATVAAPTLRGLDTEYVERAAATTQALRDWVTGSGLDALAVRCWPEFPVEFGVCPCSSLGRLHEADTPAACERDVNGAATMLLLSTLDTAPSYLMDLVDVDEQANIVRFWHCGSAPLSLAADPAQAEQTVHCNRRIGVAGNFALRPGRVTIVRLSRTAGEFRLLITGGDVLRAANRFQGNTAQVRLDPDAGRFVHDLIGLGFEHHTVLVWADLRAQLRAVANLVGIPVFEW